MKGAGKRGALSLGKRTGTMGGVMAVCVCPAEITMCHTTSQRRNLKVVTYRINTKQQYSN